MNASRIMRRIAKNIGKNNVLKYARAGNSAHMDLVNSVDDVTYSEEISKHRSLVRMYDLHPYIDDNYIAPSATLVGEVFLQKWSTVWNNVVLRGEINQIQIGNYASIGDNTVVQTVASLPTSLPARVYIGNNVTIHNDCCLSSCHIEPDVVIGAKSVVLEGARLEEGSMIAPGTVVPPGRLIPAKQLWAGNPAEYVKDLDIGELFANYSLSYVNTFMGDMIKETYTLWPSNYLAKQSDLNDVDPDGSYSQHAIAMSDADHVKHYSP